MSEFSDWWNARYPGTEGDNLGMMAFAEEAFEAGATSELAEIATTFGSPPHTLEEWLRIYADDTDAYRRIRLTPWGRAESRGRVGGLEDALGLIKHLRTQSGFPVTLSARKKENA